MGTNRFLNVLPELVSFARVAELGSFSAAAQQLGMTPSAVSRQVSRLEAELGIQLMVRTTRHVRLTPAGADAFAHCRDLVEAARAAVEVGQQHASEPHGQVRISAPKAFARHVLHPVVDTFLTRYPAVDVQLVVMDRDVDPIREGVDLVVRITRNPPPGLVARHLLPVQQILCASAAYLAAAPPLQHPEDLVHHSCLSLGEHEHDNRWRFALRDDPATPAVTVTVHGRYVVNHSELRLDAACAHRGIACVPDFVARAALAAGRVQQVLIPWEMQSSYQGHALLLFPQQPSMPPKTRALADHLLQALSPLQAG